MINTSNIQKAARVILGGFLIMAGCSHLTWERKEFLAQVPKWLPMNADLVVVLSGIVEILLGIAIVFWASKRWWVGWIAALFFIIVFPGNISQYTHHLDAFGLNTDTKRLIRLFFQPVLVIWALWCCGSLKTLGEKRIVKA